VAADFVADSIARHTPNSPAAYQQGVYSSATSNAISGGDGAGLTLAIAAALKQRGKICGSRSPAVRNAVAAALSAPGTPSGDGSVVQASFVSPAWSIPNSTRSFINAWFRHQDAQTKALSRTPNTAKGTFTVLSAVGFGPSVESVLAKHFDLPFSSVQDKAAGLRQIWRRNHQWPRQAGQVGHLRS